MLSEGRLISRVKTAMLAAALVVYPCSMLAQHGGGGGHIGGGTAGGGGLSGGGRATGVDIKDDLKGFHAALAVQASSQQIVEYNLMLKHTEAATVELKAFLEQAGKEKNASGIASHDKTLEQAVETARDANKKFLEGFSDRQKTGLKEITKKLSKADSDLAQQAKALDQAVEANAAALLIATSAQNLDRTLAGFRSEELNLGEEMGIENSTTQQNVAFNIAPVKTTIGFANQTIVLTTSGVISEGAAEAGQNTFKLQLIADLSDLQENLTEVLRAALNKADRCGEQIAIQGATLEPREPASLVVVQMHFERWACIGRDANEMVEGNGTVEVKLMPAIADDGGLRLMSEIGRVDAQGLLGESLRSGSLGDTLRDKITESMLSTIRQAADFKMTLPSAAQDGTTLHRARFEGTGSGKLMAVLDGEIRVSNDKATSLTSELKSQTPSQPTMPR